MKKKDEDRLYSHHSHQSPLAMPSSDSSKKWFCFGIIFFLLLGIALTVAGLGYYIQYEQRRKATKETHAYMRSMINQINNAPDVRWKVSFNKLIENNAG